MPHSGSLLAELRRRVQDVRHSRRAVSLAIKDQQVTTAIAEVTQGHLVVTVAGGTAPTIDLDLTNPRYDTIGRLYQVLCRVPGYVATLDEDANLDHSSIDIEPFPPLDIRSTGVELNHHTFSDFELDEILREAVTRHNPSLTLSTLPPQEGVFVLALAQANVCRVLASDASKRRGLDKDVKTLLMLATAYEDQYADDTKRLARAIQSPKEANSNLVSEGDVMLGKSVRRSLRTGFMSPLSQTIPPDAAVLLEPDQHDVEDDNIRVSWQRNKNYDFYSYELWMDTRPEVIRTQEGGVILAGTPVSYLNSEDVRRNSALRQTTSVMVFRSFGSNSTSSRASFSTFVEEFGQLIRAFNVGNLESDTEYYFRLYVVGINYVSTASNVVRGRTLALRSRFLPVSRDALHPGPVGQAFSVTSGPPGTVVTITLDNTKAAFTTSYVLKLGEKTITPTIVTGYQLQATIPAFQTIGPKDWAIISPNQLVDTRSQAFTVTA